MAEHAYDEFDLVASRPEATVRSFGTPVRSEATPESWDDLKRYPEYDFGPLRVRVPADAEMRMADPDAMYSDAAFFVFPDGKVRLSVLAAPRGGRLWPERAEEIATMQANLGADVRSYTGEWGRELQITDDGATNWVIGVDGPRWMLLGRSTCPLGADTDLADTMRDMIRSSVVFRGNEPLPVRTPLTLRQPGTFDAEDVAEDRTGTPYAGVVTLILPRVEAPVADDPIDRQVIADVDGEAVASSGAGLGAAAPHTLHPAATAPAATAPVTANPDWAIAARAASDAATADTTSRDAGRSAPVEPAPEARLQQNGDEALDLRRPAAADSGRRTPRWRGGPLAAAAVILVVGLTGLVFALRGSTPGDTEPSLASPRQVDETLTPKQAYPDDAYAAVPKAPTVVPPVSAAKSAPPLAAGPALKGAAPVPGVPGVKPATPRATSPVRSSPVPANGAGTPLPDSVARTPASGPSRSTSAPAAQQSRPGPDPHAAPDNRSRGSRSRFGNNDGGQGDGPIGVLSNDVLRVLPGLG